MGSFHFPTEEDETLSKAEIGNGEQKSQCPRRTELLKESLMLGSQEPPITLSMQSLYILHIPIDFIYFQKPTFILKLVRILIYKIISCFSLALKK